MEQSTDEKSKLFRGLVTEETTDLIKYKKGQYIYLEGNTPLGVFLIKEGKVKIAKSGSSGKEQIIKILQSGDIINYSELITNKKFKSTAKAIEDSSLFFIGKEEFRSLLKKQPQITEQFVIHLSNELLNAEDRIADISYKPVKARIADALIGFSNENQGAITISRKDLACFVGTAKETLNRIISELKREEAIFVSKGALKIKNISKLKSLSN